MFLDATYCKARINGRVVSQSVVIATGVSADGHRDDPCCQVTDSETEEFGTEFLRDLRGRGPAGVQLITPDAHSGLAAAVGAVLRGAALQRCQVHFMRTCSPWYRWGEGEMVATWIRAIFTMGTPSAVRAQLDHVAQTLAASHPRVAEMLREAKLT